MNPILITDLDNTLYDWIEFSGVSFRGMIHALSKKMNLSEDELYNGFRKVYSEKGTLDDAFTIQHLPFISDYSEEEIDDFVETGKKVYQIIKKRHLKAYPGVKSTLEFLHEQGIRIYGVTNAPIFRAERRLNQLGLDKFFTGIAGWEGPEYPTDKYTLEVLASGKYKSKRIAHRWVLSKEDLKPNSKPYNLIFESAKNFSAAFVLGDSIEKDLIPVKDNPKVITIWARYGNKFDKKNFETILKITNWGKDEIDISYKEKGFDPNEKIDFFHDLRYLIQGPQLSLFKTSFKYSNLRIMALIGAPFSGKGTQGKLLSKKMGLAHLSTGERIRYEKDLETDFSKKVEKYERSGELVPDKIIEELLEKIVTENLSADGMILDGFPRTKGQVDSFLRLLDKFNVKLSLVIYLKVSDDILLRRASFRKQEITRSDDKTELQEKRIRLFKEVTIPAIEYLKEKIRTIEIDANGTIDEVNTKLIDELNYLM